MSTLSCSQIVEGNGIMKATQHGDGSITLEVDGGVGTNTIRLYPERWEEAFCLLASMIYEDKPTDLHRFAQDKKIRDELDRVRGLLNQLLSC